MPPIRRDDTHELTIFPTDAKRIERVVGDMSVARWAELAGDMIRRAKDGAPMVMLSIQREAYPHHINWTLVERYFDQGLQREVEERVRVRVTVERKRSA